MMLYDVLYDLAVVGAGSVAAYYLNTVDRSRYAHIICIGGEDPWAGTRGVDASKPESPVNFINHTAPMIGHFGDNVPPTSRTLYRRTDFAKANRAIIDRCTEKFEQGIVDHVELMRLPLQMQWGSGKHNGFRLSVGTRFFYAKKVVIATGAGGHSVPKEAQLAHQSHPERVMDMDEFARKAPQISPKNNVTVFVLGPNAPVDAVELALFEGFKVDWLLGDSAKGPQQPTLLGTGHQVYALGQQMGQNKREIHFWRDSLKVAASGTQVEVSFKPANNATEQTIDGHYFVYGIGQAQNEGEAKKLISFVDSKIRERLAPLYDINQRFGPAHESVLGFELNRTPEEEKLDPLLGFEMIGAMTAQVIKAQDIPHNYLRELERRIKEVADKVIPHLIADSSTDILTTPLNQLANLGESTVEDNLDAALFKIAGDSPSWKEYAQPLCALLLNYVIAAEFFKKRTKVTAEDLNKVTANMTTSILQSPQLGAGRATTAAQNGFVPKYTANGQANFAQDDRTMLRAYIAAHFPFVTEKDAQAFINKVLQQKKSVPWGFEEGPSNDFVRELTNLNGKSVAPLTRPKVSGTGQTSLDRLD
ncbi:MAG: hypothetical protein ACREQ4_12155 [Candidatus Binataceae bacterium]